MADLKQIQFKRSNTAGKRPLPADIAEGELAINIKDATLFTKNADGAIIDLGFAKGGRIDGNVVQIGNYTQTGDYTTSGDINAKTITLSAGVISNGDVLAQRGVIRTRANDTSNAHLWFEGNEMGSDVNYERGVLYARPNTATEGTISFRVMNGFDNNKAQALFNFRGNGDFNAPRDVTGRDYTGQRVRLTIEAVAPTMNASRLYTRDRQWGQFGAQQDEGYGWNDLVNYTEGQDGALKLNYVYKGRAFAGGVIWHDLIDERDGAERAVYTGGTAAIKQFALKNNVGAAIRTSLMIGNPSLYSAMSGSSIALGGVSTGMFSTNGNDIKFRSTNRVTNFEMYDNGQNISNSRLTIQYTANNGAVSMPVVNTAVLTVVTSSDDNATGDSQTHLGYNANGVYNHYLRGSGSTNIETKGGTRITQGDLNVTNTIWGGSTINAASGFRANGGDFTFRGPAGRHIRWEYLKNDGTYAVDGYIFKDGPDQANRRPGIRISCGTPDKANGNTSDSGTFVFAENGEFILPGGGMINQDGMNQNVYAMSALSTTARGSKNYLRRMRGGSGDTIWHETVQSNIWRLATGNTDAQDELSIQDGNLKARQTITAGNELVALGSSIRVRSAGTSHVWFQDANGNEKGVIYAENNGNTLKFRAQQTNGGGANSTLVFGYDGVLTVPRHVAIGSTIFGSDGNITNGGAWSQGGGNLHTHIENRCSAWARQEALKAVQKTGDTMTGQLRINKNNDSIVINGPGASDAVYIRGQNAGVNKWYIGNGSNTNEYLTMRSDALNTQLVMTNSVIEFNRQVNAPEFYLSSDVKLKTSIIDIESQREKLHDVEIKRYAMKDGSNDNAIGVIAQQIEDVYPELVSSTSDGMKSVNYRGLSTVLWKIVQEQDKELDDVKARLARIEELLSK